MIEVGQIVKWREPLSEAEATERHLVLEVNGDRCIIQYVCDWSLKPTSLARTAELEVVASREMLSAFVEPSEAEMYSEAAKAIGRAMAKNESRFHLDKAPSQVTVTRKRGKR